MQSLSPKILILWDHKKFLFTEHEFHLVAKIFHLIRIWTRSSLLVKRVKDSVLSLLWLRVLLGCRFNPWPADFLMPQVRP